MMDDLLRLILAAADDVGRVFDFATTATWPSGAVETFKRLGVLRQAAGSLHAPCTRRFYIHCPEELRVEVRPEMCVGWEIDPDGLAKVVAMSMGLVGRPQPVVAARFWRLGRTSWPPGTRKTRPVVFVRRMGDDDASSIAAHVGPGGRAIVLVPHHVPDERIWPGSVPAVIPLTEVMTWGDGQPVLDVMAMVDAVETADHLAEAAEAISLGSTGKKMVRRQVKAEIKSLLTDDTYVSAYKEHGSYRKAADALTEQTGQPISKDKVRRAVERRGGLAEIVPDGDSASVARTVASQRRDRAKKFIERR